MREIIRYLTDLEIKTFTQKIKYITILMLLLSICSINNSFAQKDKPTWAKSSFHKSLDNSYLQTIEITGNSREDIRIEADKAIEQWRLRTVGAGQAVVKSLFIADYYEENNGELKGYILYQTLKNPSYEYENVESSGDYNVSAHVFVPGMAQIHKGSTGKGIAFISGEVIFVGVIIVAESLKAIYESEINSTHNTYLRNSYINSAHICETISYCAIGSAAVTYVWNVIDGCVAKGKPHIIIGVFPYAMLDGGGVSLKINF